MGRGDTDNRQNHCPSQKRRPDCPIKGVHTTDAIAGKPCNGDVSNCLAQSILEIVGHFPMRQGSGQESTQNGKDLMPQYLQAGRVVIFAPHVFRDNWPQSPMSNGLVWWWLWCRWWSFVQGSPERKAIPHYRLVHIWVEDASVRRRKGVREARRLRSFRWNYSITRKNDQYDVGRGSQ